MEEREYESMGWMEGREGVMECRMDERKEGEEEKKTVREGKEGWVSKATK